MVAVDVPPRLARRAADRRALLRSGWGRGGGLVVAAAVLLLALAFGAKPLPLRTVWEALTAPDLQDADHLVVRSLRVPRTLIGLGMGIALGLAAVGMQGITRNPLADPGIFGIEAGASLAVVTGIHVLGVTSLTGYVWFAFAGAGAAMAALFASLTSAILLVDVTTLDQFRFWAVGSLAGRDAAILEQVLPFLVVGVLLSLASARGLDALALGDDVARSLGQRVQLTRTLSAVAVVVCAGAAVAAAGPIGFIGLTIPHVARAICGPDHRGIMAWSILLAPTLLLAGRVVARPGELQVGIVTAFIGAPFFVLLVRRRKLAEL